MTMEKQHVFSARTTEDGLKRKHGNIWHMSTCHWFIKRLF